MNDPFGEVLDHSNSSDVSTEVEDEMDYAAALALKRNLNVAFEKHVDDDKAAAASSQPQPQPQPAASHEPRRKPLQERNQLPSSSTAVAAPAAAAAAAAALSSSDAAAGLTKKRRMEQNWQKAVSQQQQKQRPPKHPSIRATASSVTGMQQQAQQQRKSDSKLKVFVRIRPDPNSECNYHSNDNNSDDKSSYRVGTIESLSCTEQSNDKKQQKNAIRTYAPVDSNAMKCARPGSASSSSNFSRNRSSSNNDAMVPIKEYKFERVFGPDDNQEMVYRETTAPLVDNLFQSNPNNKTRRSGLLFAYGITNAGKTYTIGNYSPKYKEKWGILPRAMHQIFAKLKENEKSGAGLELFLSYFEVYNEKLYDLLPIRQQQQRQQRYDLAISKSLKLTDHGKHGIYVKGLARHQIKNVEHGLELVNEAIKNRQTCSNNINSSSSRSHCICQFELIEQTNSNNNRSLSSESVSSTNATVSDVETSPPPVLWIVDLAGSERAKRTKFGSASSKQQREAAQINQSLTTLMRCISQLVSNYSSSHATNSTSKQQQMMPPYRDSKLTHLLMSHLSGVNAGKTAMIVNVNPSAQDYDETQHVLSYATVAREVFISADDYYRRAPTVASRDSSSKLGKRGYSSDTDSIVNIHKRPPSRGRRGYASDTDSVGSRRSNLHRQQSSKVARMGNKKLSPRQALVKKASSFMKRNSKKDHDNKTNLFSSKNSHKSKEIDFLRNETKRFKSTIIALETENSQLRARAERLEEDLYHKETEIRQEMTNEMETQIKKMREEYIAEERLSKKTAPTPSQSTRKLRVERTEKYIDELLDKLEEQEDEIVRLKMRHAEEIKQLKDEIALLEEEMLDQDINSHDNDLDEEIRRDTILQAGRTKRQISKEEGGVEKGKELVLDEDVVRLPRSRTSEVACAKESEVAEVRESIASSSRKSSPQKFRRVLRSMVGKQDS